MQSYPDFVGMANEAHNLAVYNQLYEHLNNFNTIEHVFVNECIKSEKLLFVACEILSKKLIKHELFTGVDDMEINSTTGSTAMDDKKFTMFKICNKIYEIINNAGDKLTAYITRSCINVISLCISSTVTSVCHFESIFLNYIKLLVPDFRINEDFVQSRDNQLAFIEPSPTALGFHHQYMIEIMISLLDYIINSTYFMNYYYFRRNLYAFRNHYLGYMLNYSIFCIKSMFRTTIDGSNVQTLSLSKSIRPALKLFEAIVTYPFSLNMH